MTDDDPIVVFIASRPEVLRRLLAEHVDDGTGHWQTLITLANALVARSADQFRGWGDVVIFAACTDARIGEFSGCRVGDIDTVSSLWTVRRQTTPSPGGLVDKGTKGKRARSVPLIVEVREMVRQRIDAASGRPDARLTSCR